MRLHEIITEGLSDPLPYEWTKRDPKWFKAQFQYDDINYWVNCYAGNWAGDPCWSFDFGITEASAKSRGGWKTTGPTGYGNPLPILSTVKAVLDDFIKSRFPALIVFYDGDHVRGRSRLYNRFADYICSRWPYDRDEALMAKTKRESSTEMWAFRRREFTATS
jgi:hypothetical protein